MPFLHGLSWIRLAIFALFYRYPIGLLVNMELTPLIHLSVAGNEILPSSQVDLCSVSTYGCCKDGVTAAGGPNYQGCDEPCQVGVVWCSGVV